MKIKSLLLGSAAAMIAVSGAQAADAIVIEAEPMEYVKVCDMYGQGFFYIPGTEICMNINGYVRSTYSHSERDISIRNAAGVAAPTADYSDAAGLTVNSVKLAGSFDPITGAPITTPNPDYTAGTTNTSNWNVRARLNFDVRNETEYGTLTSVIRLQAGDADVSGGRPNVALDRALISLAGFRLGYTDSYWATNHGYAAGSGAINDGYYGFHRAIIFDYTAQLMDGVSVTVGVQDRNGAAAGAASPDFYAGLNATFGGLTVAATAMRDDIGGGNDEWAYKVSAIMGLGDSGWTVGGWYSNDDGASQYVNGNFGALSANNNFDTEWGVQANGAVAANLSVYGLYSEAEGDTAVATLDQTQWAVGAVWAPVSQLTVQFEYYNAEAEINQKADLRRVNVDDDGFAIRVTRSF